MIRTDEICRRREARGLTMLEAAKLAGFRSAQQWNNIEKGWKKNIRAETLYVIAKALNCTMEDLIRADDAKPRRR